MALASVNIRFTNGALGRTGVTNDGVIGFLCQVTVEGNLVAGEAYLLRNLKGLEDLGITNAVNPVLQNVIKDFYETAGNGAPVWIMGYTGKTLAVAINDHLESLVQKSSYDVKTVFVYGNSFTNATITDGFNDEFHVAVTAAQTKANLLLTNKEVPVAVIIDGNTAYDGAASVVRNYNTASNDRVGAYLGKKTSADKTTTTLGYLMARIAISPVQRNIARVKDGAIFTGNLYVGSQLAEVHDVETLHDRGYITIRTHVGKSGYYFTDDRLLSNPTGDYANLTNRRVIDKAYRIAYVTAIDGLLDEIPVNSNGTIQAHKAIVIESQLQSAIYNEMGLKGELSLLADNPNDKGVVVTVDLLTNIQATSRVDVSIKVTPYAYARSIEIPLGFQQVN
jgi:hypothetical protein